MSPSTAPASTDASWSLSPSRIRRACGGSASISRPSARGRPSTPRRPAPRRRQRIVGVVAEARAASAARRRARGGWSRRRRESRRRPRRRHASAALRAPDRLRQPRRRLAGRREQRARAARALAARAPARRAARGSFTTVWRLAGARPARDHAEAPLQNAGAAPLTSEPLRGDARPVLPRPALAVPRAGTGASSPSREERASTVGIARRGARADRRRQPLLVLPVALQVEAPGRVEHQRRRRRSPPPASRQRAGAQRREPRFELGPSAIAPARPPHRPAPAPRHSRGRSRQTCPCATCAARQRRREQDLGRSSPPMRATARAKCQSSGDSAPRARSARERRRSCAPRSRRPLQRTSVGQRLDQRARRPIEEHAAAGCVSAATCRARTGRDAAEVALVVVARHALPQVAVQREGVEVVLQEVVVRCHRATQPRAARSRRRGRRGGWTCSRRRTSAPRAEDQVDEALEVAARAAAKPAPEALARSRRLRGAARDAARKPRPSRASALARPWPPRDRKQELELVEPRACGHVGEREAAPAPSASGVSSTSAIARRRASPARTRRRSRAAGARRRAQSSPARSREVDASRRRVDQRAGRAAAREIRAARRRGRCACAQRRRRSAHLVVVDALLGRLRSARARRRPGREARSAPRCEHRAAHASHCEPLRVAGRRRWYPAAGSAR